MQNNLIKVNLTPNQMNNILTFLDRVEVKGWNEVTSMMELLNAFKSNEETVKE
jgi:hypothetical protein